MDIQQLRIFVAVADALHVTRAAERLGLTQPAASSAIAALERRYNTKLFDRVGRGIELTETGRRFLMEARAILERIEAATAVLEDAADQPTGRISITASQTIAGYWLPRRLAAFRRAYPSITLEVVATNGAAAEQAVVDGTADIGCVARAFHPGLVRHEIVRDRMLLLQARGAGFLHAPLRKRDLLNAPWLLRSEGSDAHAAMQHLARSRNLDWHGMNVSLVLPSNEAVREAIEGGDGVGIISEHVVRASIAAGRMEAIPADLPDRIFMAIRHRDRQATRAQQLFLAFLRDWRDDGSMHNPPYAMRRLDVGPKRKQT